MASRTKFTVTFEAERVIQPFYTGGDVALGGEGRILATCLGEEALLTNLATGQLLARLEGVRLSGCGHVFVAQFMLKNTGRMANS